MTEATREPEEARPPRAAPVTPGPEEPAKKRLRFPTAFTVELLLEHVTEFAAGSMGPKVRAACSFVEQTGGLAAIGSIEHTAGLVRGEAGTVVARDAAGLELVGAS